jgi:predicted aspartyl protease
MQQQNAITHRSTLGLLNAIICEAMVTAPFTGVPSTSESLPTVKVKGLWDTGATGSVITKAVADSIGIQPTGRKIVHHANGSDEVNTYLVNFVLPGNVVITGVNATEGKLSGIDILIGMDVISLGDFSITNYKGKTVMSFRVPSCHEIDYIKHIQEVNERAAKEAQRQHITRYLPKPKRRKKRR